MHVEGWNNYPLPKYVSDYFHLPVRMGNDGNVAALGEWHYGSHAKPDHFMYIQISTGIGGGFILNRELYLGRVWALKSATKKFNSMKHRLIPVLAGVRDVLKRLRQAGVSQRCEKAE